MPNSETVVSCSAEGCERTDIKAKGLCVTHYDRQWAHTKRGDVPERVLAKDQPCAFAGCERLVGSGGARGYCPSHARAFYKGTLGRQRKAVDSPVAECPVCHQVKRLDRNHPVSRLRVCQTCYRGRVPVEERKKPGPKPAVYKDRTACSEGHPYSEDSFKVDGLGRRYCLVCLDLRRKTHCPQGHPYSGENVLIVNGSPQCRTCRNDRQRRRRNTGIGQGGVNAAKTHCPRGHEYTPENTRLSSDGRRSCRLCAKSNAAVQNLKRFSLTVEQFEAMMAEQNNACAICGRSFFDVTPHVDHDHWCCDGPYSCGKCVRSILCHNCNPMLGHAEDDPSRLRAAADYLDRFSSRPARQTN